MENIDYKTLFKLVEKYNEEALRIFNKLDKSSQEAKISVLKFGRHSDFERIEWDCSDEDSIAVHYYDYVYDLYDSDMLYIPADILFDDEKIDKWIKSEIDKTLEEREQQRKDKEKYQEEQERQEYERLKAKFEN